MNFSPATVCRTCLSTTSLHPIFLNPYDYETYTSVLHTTTGLKVEMDDGLSQHMCVSCIKFVNNSMKFRKQCKDVELYFTNIKNEQTPNLPLKFQSNSIDTEIDLGIIITESETAFYDESDSLTEEKIINVEDAKTNIHLTATPSKIHLSNDELKTEKTIELPYSSIFDETTKKQRVICKLCSKNLSIRSIDYHMARHHPGADERKVKCELCDSFIIKDKLDKHQLLMHGAESFRCTYCKLEFHNRELLIAHLSTCMLKNKKNRKVGDSGRALAECDVCNKRMQKASLRMHKKIKHAGQGPVCEHCGARLGNALRLQEHRRAKHGYQKLPCRYCDHRAASAAALKNHERRHLGERPFVCEECGAKFHAAYLLAQHRHSHRPDRQYKCDQCPASFKANNSLHTHKRSCHSARAYRCGVCQRAYRCRPYAAKHARRAHAGEHAPVLCDQAAPDKDAGDN